MTISCTHTLKELLTIVNDRLDVLVPQGSEAQAAEVIEAARYALLGQGKKIRPLLAIAAYSLFHSDIYPILDAACSIELIHTYSLIHDDLPSLDNDDMRRGRPTVHKAFSESTAILAGDFLLTHAFSVLAETPLPPDTRLKMISLMGKLSGGYEGMIAGQAIDLKSEGHHLTETELSRLHSLKTGALIELSVQFGALAANPSEDKKKSLINFGTLYGLAFQVVDDIVDVLYPEEKHGKTVSSDMINHKATYVSELGLDGAKNKALSLIQQCDQCLKELKAHGRDVSLLKQFLELLLSKWSSF